YSVFVRTLYYVFRGRRDGGAVIRQMYGVGNRSVFCLSITIGFIGMILAYQAGLQVQRVIPDFTMLGATSLELLVRDLAASICALMLATRVGAGIAAEIGSMVVTEQVDALHMCGADPIKHLVCPRFLASLGMFTMLVVLAACVAVATGTWTASAFFGLNPRTFLSLSLLNAGDVIVGLTKCIAYGAAIPIISA